MIQVSYSNSELVFESFSNRSLGDTLNFKWWLRNWSWATCFNYQGSQYICSTGIWRGNLFMNWFCFVYMIHSCNKLTSSNGRILHQVKGISQLLKTNLEKGITEDETDLIKRKNSFGSNTYPRKKGRSFLVYYITRVCFSYLLARFSS